MAVIIRRTLNHLKIKYVKGVGALLYDAPAFYLIKAEIRFNEEKSVVLLYEQSEEDSKRKTEMFFKIPENDVIE